MENKMEESFVKAFKYKRKYVTDLIHGWVAELEEIYVDCIKDFDFYIISNFCVNNKGGIFYQNNFNKNEVYDLEEIKIPKYTVSKLINWLNIKNSILNDIKEIDEHIKCTTFNYFV